MTALAFTHRFLPATDPRRPPPPGELPGPPAAAALNSKSRSAPLPPPVLESSAKIGRPIVSHSPSTRRGARRRAEGDTGLSEAAEARAAAVAAGAAPVGLGELPLRVFQLLGDLAHRRAQIIARDERPERIAIERLPQRDAEPELICGRPDDAARVEGCTAFVSIMEGCSKYCSFCVVPYTRGEEVSRPFDDVLTEIADLADQGVLFLDTDSGLREHEAPAANVQRAVASAAQDWP